MALPGAIRRVSRALAPGLVWLGAGIAVVLLLLTLTADRLRGLPFDLNSLAGVVATFALGAILPWTLQWRRLDEMRRCFRAGVGAEAPRLVTPPRGKLGRGDPPVGGARRSSP